MRWVTEILIYPAVNDCFEAVEGYVTAPYYLVNAVGGVDSHIWLASWFAHII